MTAATRRPNGRLIRAPWLSDYHRQKMNKPEIIPPKRDVAYYLSRAAKARQDAAFMPARPTTALALATAVVCYSGVLIRQDSHP